MMVAAFVEATLQDAMVTGKVAIRERHRIAVGDPFPVEALVTKMLELVGSEDEEIHCCVAAVV